MLLSFENTGSYTYLFVVVLIQLFTSFESLNAIELPLELLHDGGVNILPKSTDYARRMAFPLASSSDVSGGSVEMPPNVEDNLDFNSNSGNAGNNGDDENDDIDDDLTTKTEMSKWLQLQMQQEHPHQQQQHQHLQLDHLNYRNMLQQKPKHLKQQQQQQHHHNHHQSNRHLHVPPTTSSTVSPLRRCSIEISSKIPGICQSMGSIGNACVSGDYIDVFNAECL